VAGFSENERESQDFIYIAKTKRAQCGELLANGKWQDLARIVANGRI
jgi:hypothetical protein